MYHHLRTKMRSAHTNIDNMLKPARRAHHVRKTDKCWPFISGEPLRMAKRMMRYRTRLCIIDSLTCEKPVPLPFEFSRLGKLNKRLKTIVSKDLTSTINAQTIDIKRHRSDTIRLKHQINQVQIAMLTRKRLNYAKFRIISKLHQGVLPILRKARTLILATQDVSIFYEIKS